MPPHIKIPPIKFYLPKEYKFLDTLLSAFNIDVSDDDDDERLRRLQFRMSIRDDEGALEKKLAALNKVYDEWCDIPNMLGQLIQSNDVCRFLAKGVSGCLLEHVDSWICGHSFVSYKKYDDKFNKELEKLEDVYDLYARGESTNYTPVKSVEIFLDLAVVGTFFDKDIHCREDLVEVLQHLHTLEGRKERVLSIEPLYCTGYLAKEKLNQIEGYAHICLGKFP